MQGKASVLAPPQNVLSRGGENYTHTHTVDSLFTKLTKDLLICQSVP